MNFKCLKKASIKNSWREIMSNDCKIDAESWRNTNLLLLLLRVEHAEVENISLRFGVTHSLRPAFHSHEPCFNFLSLRFISVWPMLVFSSQTWEGGRRGGDGGGSPKKHKQEKRQKSSWKINKLIDFWCFYLEPKHLPETIETWIITSVNRRAWQPIRIFVSLRNSMSHPTVHVSE